MPLPCAWPSAPTPGTVHPAFLCSKNPAACVSNSPVLAGVGYWGPFLQLKCLLLLHRRVVTMELTEANMRQPFSAIRMLVARALGLQAGETCEDWQRTLQAKLQGVIEESRYCLLNNIFLVKVRARGRPPEVVWWWFGCSAGLGVAVLIAPRSDSWVQGGSLSVVTSCPVHVPGVLVSTLERPVKRGLR